MDTSIKRWKIIGASSVGTLIEWYDFYIFGSLATLLSTKFFPSDNPVAAFMATLATFAAGFIVRPFGALFFGRLGDLIGRKHTFMVTLLLMGGATFLIGCIPSYESIGYLAPFLVLLLRLLQGLALGGEYGGAATYVAEHSPANQRGYWTSWIQTTATVGLLMSLLVIMITKSTLSEDQFKAWGWRIPFWLSILMVIISYLIRKNMTESPLFAKEKKEGKLSKNPLKESFGNRYNFKFVLLALFGATMGQGVVWYTGQFYVMSFIEKICLVDKMQSDTLIALALLIATPFFLVFGALSDKIGRKPLLICGMLFSIISYRPVFREIYSLASCPTLTNTKAIVSYKTIINKKNNTKIETKTTSTNALNGNKLIEIEKKINGKGKEEKENQTLVILTKRNQFYIGLLVFTLVFFITMVYGPIAAFLVELFPVKIRYTSMSLPYHIGNGVFGGLLPAVATYLASTAQKANELAQINHNPIPYSEPYLEGLWYPIGITSICLIICIFYVRKRFLNTEIIQNEKM